MPRTGILRRKFVAAWPFPCPAIPTKGRLLPLSRRTHKAGAGKLAISPRPITYSYMSSHPLSEARLVPSTLCACATVLISCVWSRPRSLGTLFFVFNRYLPFIDVFLSLSAKTTRISAEQCLTRFKIVGWLTVIGIFLSEVILMLRTYALWERRRGALISLSILSTCTVISTATYPQKGVGCQLEMASSIVIYAYLTLMISETSELRAFRASTIAPLAATVARPAISRWNAVLRLPTRNITCEYFGTSPRSLDVFKLVGNPPARATLHPVYQGSDSHTWPCRAREWAPEHERE
ncbi:hypothetical protein DFH09DRAFT_1181692 [Mycena vulgaris]|nr:hypothetical protein DFH09DRAFT_1181692 [Mycena vulgaris]